MSRQTRRGFLRDAALGGAGLVILSDSRSARAYAANDKLNVALIGVGGRGKWYGRDGQYTVSDFRNTGPYTEFLLLANVATQINGSIEYDPVAGKITNNEQANALFTCERRKGWSL